MNLACTLYFIVEAEEWWNFQEFTASFLIMLTICPAFKFLKSPKYNMLCSTHFFEFYADYINTSFCDKKAPKTSYFEKYFFYVLG